MEKFDISKSAGSLFLPVDDDIHLWANLYNTRHQYRMLAARERMEERKQKVDGMLKALGSIKLGTDSSYDGSEDNEFLKSNFDPINQRITSVIGNLLSGNETEKSLADGAAILSEVQNKLSSDPKLASTIAKQSMIQSLHQKNLQALNDNKNFDIQGLTDYSTLYNKLRNDYVNNNITSDGVLQGLNSFNKLEYRNLDEFYKVMKDIDLNEVMTASPDGMWMIDNKSVNGQYVSNALSNAMMSMGRSSAELFNLYKKVDGKNVKISADEYNKLYKQNFANKDKKSNIELHTGLKEDINECTSIACRRVLGVLLPAVKGSSHKEEASELQKHKYNIAQKTHESNLRKSENEYSTELSMLLDAYKAEMDLYKNTAGEEQSQHYAKAMEYLGQIRGIVTRQSNTPNVTIHGTPPLKIPEELAQGAKGNAFQASLMNEVNKALDFDVSKDDLKDENIDKTKQKLRNYFKQNYLFDKKFGLGLDEDSGLIGNIMDVFDDYIDKGIDALKAQNSKKFSFKNIVQAGYERSDLSNAEWLGRQTVDFFGVGVDKDNALNVLKNDPSHFFEGFQKRALEGYVFKSNESFNNYFKEQASKALSIDNATSGIRSKISEVVHNNIENFVVYNEGKSINFKQFNINKKGHPNSYTVQNFSINPVTLDISFKFQKDGKTHTAFYQGQNKAAILNSIKDNYVSDLKANPNNQYLKTAYSPFVYGYSFNKVLSDVYKMQINASYLQSNDSDVDEISDYTTYNGTKYKITYKKGDKDIKLTPLTGEKTSNVIHLPAYYSGVFSMATSNNLQASLNKQQSLPNNKKSKK